MPDRSGNDSQELSVKSIDLYDRFSLMVGIETGFTGIRNNTPGVAREPNGGTLGRHNDSATNRDIPKSNAAKWGVFWEINGNK